MAGDHVVKPLHEGVVYHKLQKLEGPWWIHVIEIDVEVARSAGVRFKVESDRSETGGMQPTSVLAKDALAAVNGDFFYLLDSRLKTGIHIQDGQVFHTPQSLSLIHISEPTRPY